MGGVGDVCVPDLVPQVHDVAEGHEVVAVGVGHCDHHVDLGLRDVVSQGVSQTLAADVALVLCEERERS